MSGRFGLLAEALQREINTRGAGLQYRRAVVMSDEAFLGRSHLHRHPTIMIGGPGVNAAAQHYAPDLPTVWQEEDRSFVQAALDDEEKRVALWGMDGQATARAVDAFMAEGILDLLLERIWRIGADAVM